MPRYTRKSIRRKKNDTIITLPIHPIRLILFSVHHFAGTVHHNDDFFIGDMILNTAQSFADQEAYPDIRIENDLNAFGTFHKASRALSQLRC